MDIGPATGRASRIGRPRAVTGTATTALQQRVSPRRVKLAYATAIVADIMQLPVNLSFFSWGIATLGGSVPLEAIDTGIDVVAAVIINRLIGFHWALLPTFALELVPGLDALPTWTACVAYVTMRRRKKA
jgi:hypothetical protein